MRPTLAGTARLHAGGTIPHLQSSNFPHIEITDIFAPNVSSQAAATKQFSRARNHFPLFVQTSRNASLINNSPNETPLGVGIGSLSCRTSSPSTPQPKKSIAAARATSDEMLLQSIAKGDRTAMHVLYSPSQCAGLPLRAAHRARHHDGGRPRQPGVPRRVAHRQPVRGPLAGLHLAAVDRPLQGADRAAPAQA